MKLISLIVPVLNEEEAIPLFYDAVQDVLHDEPYDVEILFIDDGSTDRTLEIIEGLHARDPRVRGISFSRNFGKELALAAGLQAARGGCRRAHGRGPAGPAGPAQTILAPVGTRV